MAKETKISVVSIVVPSLAQKGPVVVARNLAIGLQERGVQVIFFYCKETSFQKIKLPDGIPILKLQRQSLSILLKSQIIHTHSFLPDIISSLLFVFYRKKIKFFTTIHNDLFEEIAHSELSIIKKLILKYISPISWYLKHSCVALNENIQEKYAKALPFLKKKLHYCYNGILIEEEVISTQDIASLQAIRQLKQNYRIIGSCAAIVKRKGLDVAIRSMLLLDPSFIFVIVGDGPHKPYLQELTNELNLSERVYFFPYTSNPLSYMKLFDIFIMPSYSEGFGLTAVEAISQNCKLVLSNITVFKFIFGMYDTIKFTSLDPNHLAHAVVEASAIPVEGYQTEAKKILTQFSYQEMTKNYLNLYINAN